LVKERDRLIEELVELRTQGEGGQEELYRQAGLMILDGEGAIVMTDTGAHHLLDLPAGPIAGMLLPVAYPNAELAEVVDSLLAPEPYVQRRAQVGLEEGEVQATLVALPPDGAPPKFVVVELKTKEVDDVQDAVAVAANALRTPATFIRSYGDLLLTPGAGALNETQEDFVERIQANAERLLQRLDDLLLLLAPEKGRVHLTPKPMDLLTVIEGSLPGMSAWLRTQKVALRLALPDRLPTVHADPQAVRHIVRRLLSNAALCSPSGATITIGAETLADPEEDEPSHVRISVHDACGGIAPDDLEEIFYLPHAARSPRVKGVGESGAGLALAHRLAEAQEGRLTVETERGEGSTFHLTLPIYTEKPPT
jgi:signal transduction histidine kinase